MFCTFDDSKFKLHHNTKIRDKGALWGDFIVIKGGEIGNQLRVG
jgi:hypothetical protein